MISSQEFYQKKGYLEQHYKLFHLRDQNQKHFEYHYHDFNKIILFLQGDVTYSIEGKNYPLMPYDLILVKAGELHRPSILSAAPYERIILYISPQFIQKYKTPEYNLEQCFELSTKASSHVLRLPSMKRSPVFQTLLALEKSSHHTEAFANSLHQDLLFLEFLIQMNRAVLQHNLNFIETNPSNEKIAECLEYINTHLQDSISIDALANRFFVSKYYLMHRFKEETGFSIGTYLSAKRLLLARELIQNGMSVTEACYESGFHNYSTFFRAWKKHFGFSPTT